MARPAAGKPLARRRKRLIAPVQARVAASCQAAWLRPSTRARAVQCRAGRRGHDSVGRQRARTAHRHVLRQPPRLRFLRPLWRIVNPGAAVRTVLWIGSFAGSDRARVLDPLRLSVLGLLPHRVVVPALLGQQVLAYSHGTRCLNCAQPLILHLGAYFLGGAPRTNEQVGTRMSSAPVILTRLGPTRRTCVCRACERSRRTSGLWRRRRRRRCGLRR
jgi:hypothetical protein